MVDESYWAAAKIVVNHVAESGSSDKVVAYHERGIRQLAEHLIAESLDFTEQSVQAWLDEGASTWSPCKFKENRAAARRLLEAMASGKVEPSPYSHPGPTDYSKLTGWARSSVDAYAAAAEAEFSEREGYLARMYASQFLVSTGLADANPPDVTADIIVGYVRTCPGAKSVRAARLSHLRGFLSSLIGRGEAKAWAPMLADDRFASSFECFAPFAAPDADGSDPSVCIDLSGPFDAALCEEGYSRTPRKTAARTLAMLYMALELNGVPYTPGNAEAWLASALPHLGKGAPAVSRMLDLFAGFAAKGSLATTPRARRPDPLASAPAWAAERIAGYLALKAREGCSEKTVGCIRNSCLRLASYADESGVRAWADLGPDIVAGWCVDDEHGTAEGRACYVGKARGFLQFLEDEGLAPPGVWLAARSECAPRRKIVRVLDDSDIALADSARASASTPVELRDAAIVALGLTMGLRSSDVVALKMADISWTRSSVTIVQRKTGAQLDLPLTVQAGNALAAYLREGRPKSCSPLVFVKHRAPFDGLSRCACRRAMERTFGPHVADFHVLRRTFATSMLRGGVGRSGVAEALGHRTERTTGPYLSLDSGRMRLCALSPEECGIGGRNA